MGWRLTVGLAAALVTALLYAWFDLRTDQSNRGGGPIVWLPGPTPPAQGLNRLLSFDPSDIITIHLQRGDLDVRVNRTEGAWEGADRPELLDDFLHNLQNLGTIMTLKVTREELKEYGLDPPFGVIELVRSGQPSLVLLLGSHNPPATAAYAQLGRDGPVVLAGALLLWEFDKVLRVVNEKPS